MAADAGFIYGPDDYFAFVESFDPLVRPSSQSGADAERVIEPVLRERGALGLPRPSAAVWLDCVESRYFMRLPWKDEACRIGDADDSATRREHLARLDRQKFRVGLLLMDAQGVAERGTSQELSRAAWHRITLAQSEGLPLLTGSDFDLEADGRQMRYLRYLGRCSEAERKSLANVFSLDFVPNAKLQGRERGNPNTPPRTPKRSSEVHVEWVDRAQEREQPVQAPPALRYQSSGSG